MAKKRVNKKQKQPQKTRFITEFNLTCTQPTYLENLTAVTTSSTTIGELFFYPVLIVT